MRGRSWRRGKVPSMSGAKRVTIATDAETRLRLKQIAAQRGETMETALRAIIERELGIVRTNMRLRELNAEAG